MYTHPWTHICNTCNSSIVSFSTNAHHITSTTYMNYMCVRDPKTYQQTKNSKMQYDVRKALYIFIDIIPQHHINVRQRHSNTHLTHIRPIGCSLTQFRWSEKQIRTLHTQII